MSFKLHPRLAAGCFPVVVRNGCQVLLKDNAVFPWMLIVPEVDEGIEDLHQLPTERYTDVMELVREVSQFMDSHFGPTKLNVACIGNMVRQMHIHIVARNEDDPAWPGTVWASSEKRAYQAEEAEGIIDAARTSLR